MPDLTGPASVTVTPSIAASRPRRAPATCWMRAQRASTPSNSA
jgi:hypothetical protein